MSNDTLLQTATMSANCIIWGVKSQFDSHMKRLLDTINTMETRGMVKELDELSNEISDILSTIPNSDNRFVNRDQIASLAYVHLDLIDPTM